MSKLADAGADVGNFLGNLFTPLAGAANNLLGKTSTEETTSADESAQGTRRTLTIVIGAIAVITVGVIAWALFKKS